MTDSTRVASLDTSQVDLMRLWVGPIDASKLSWQRSFFLRMSLLLSISGSYMSYDYFQDRLWHHVLAQPTPHNSGIFRSSSLRYAALQPHIGFHIHLSTITGTMLLIALLWFGISAPLSAIGSYFGSKHGVRDINHDMVIASAQQRNFRHSEIP